MTRPHRYDEPAVEFDFDAVDDPRDDLDDLARARAAYAIAWVLAYVYTPETINLDAAFRRFVSLSYVLRPDLLNGRTIRTLSEEMGVPKSTFSDWVARTRDEIGVDGVLARARGAGPVTDPDEIQKMRESIERRIGRQ